jgi:hypothetical protein
LTERRNPGCAFGPCNDSAQVGGPGCYLCDVISMLPQRGRGATVDSDVVPDGGVDDTLKLTAEPSTKKAKKTAAPRASKKRGSQSGGLF